MTCNGSVHTIPVPRGMTAEEAWQEIITLGHLAEPDEFCTWAVVECPGADGCECSGVDRADAHRWHNDVLIGGPAGCKCEPCTALQEGKRA